MNEAVSFESLSRNAMQLSAQVIVNTADLAILLWPDGQIAEVTLGKHHLSTAAGNGFGDHRRRAIVTTRVAAVAHRIEVLLRDC